MACRCGCGCIESSEVVFEDIPEEYFCEPHGYSLDGLDVLYFDIQDRAKNRSNDVWRLINIAKAIDKNFPEMIELEDGSIFYQNIPTKEIMSEEFQKEFIWTMEMLKICDSKEDIIFTEHGVHVITPLCKKKVFWGSASESEAEWCKDNCDSIASGLMFSASMLRNRTCAAIASAAIEALRRSCKYCCGDGGFLQRCLWPLRDYCVRCDLEEIDW